MRLYADLLLTLLSVQWISGDYLGCYEDKPNRLLPDYRMEMTEIFNSPNKCIHICEKLSYQYAGVEFTKTCFCSKNKPNEDMKRSEIGCQMPCHPFSHEKCGGFWRISVYAVSTYNIPVESDGTYIGCYQDSAERLLNDFLIYFEEINTPRRCLHVCTVLGYQYAGTENGNECYCGNTKPADDKKKGENGCQSSCPYSSDKCGGIWEISVYRTSVDPRTQNIIEDEHLNSNALGCYLNFVDRPLTDYHSILFDINSPKKCLYLCKQLGFHYSGVGYRDHCFCGNNRPSEDKKADGQCLMSCPYSTEMCGGTWRLNVYSTQITSPRIERAKVKGTQSSYGLP
ncbi:uncharacterized protein [Halyomorpha halys]|uniref:uncharacterized protein n=1 Tax=Halyomorpha halys TaxID=286706 RepID=UPI0006D4DB91|nr:WSC domain-containing protein ARB_07867 [Halyomorpha halys]